MFTCLKLLVVLSVQVWTCPPLTSASSPAYYVNDGFGHDRIEVSPRMAWLIQARTPIGVYVLAHELGHHALYPNLSEPAANRWARRHLHQVEQALGMGKKKAPPD